MSEPALEELTRDDIAQILSRIGQINREEQRVRIEGKIVDFDQHFRLIV